MFRFLLIIVVLIGSRLFGGNYFPFPIEDKFIPGPEWQSYKAVKNLSGYWTDDQGKDWRIPFWENRQEELALSYSFRLAPDSLNYYLCFEGIAWKAAIYLNGRLLKIHEKPFEGLLIPIQTQWLQEQGNILRVELMNEGPGVSPGLQKSIGIHREVWILTEADSVNTKLMMPSVYVADSVIVYTPFSEQNWYNVSRERLISDLEDLEYAGVKVVYFPMEPSARVLEAFREAGYKRIQTIAGAKKLVWFNAFPLNREVYLSDRVFWKSGSGKPTPHFGQWVDPQAAGECHRSRDNLFTLLLFLIPTLGLVLFRLIHPQWFSIQFRWIYTRRLELDMVSNRKFLRPVENTLITLSRLAITSAALTLYIYYLQIHCEVPRLGFFSGSNSWIHTILVSDWNPGLIWVMIFAAELGLLVIKLFLISMMSSVYRIAWFQRVYLDLGILFSFPLVMILPAFTLYLLYAPVAHQPMIEFLAIGVALVFFVRYILLLSIGLYQQFRFTPLLIFLYICTFEILPWLLVF